MKLAWVKPLDRYCLDILSQSRECESRNLRSTFYWRGFLSTKAGTVSSPDVYPDFFIKREHQLVSVSPNAHFDYNNGCPALHRSDPVQSVCNCVEYIENNANRALVDHSEGDKIILVYR